MGKIKDKFIEFKNDLKEEFEEDKRIKEEKKTEEYKKLKNEEIKNELEFEKGNLKYIGVVVLFTFFVFAIISTVLYISFQGQFKKAFNKFINSIEVEKVNDDDNDIINNNSDNNNSNNTNNINNNSNSKQNCTNQINNTYVNNNIELSFFDGDYMVSVNNNFTEVGTYTIKDNRISVESYINDDITNVINHNYIISNDCNNITDIGDNRIYKLK